MVIHLKEQFLSLWKKYFGNAGLPIVFYYTDGDGNAEKIPSVTRTGQGIHEESEGSPCGRQEYCF